MEVFEDPEIASAALEDAKLTADVLEEPMIALDFLLRIRDFDGLAAFAVPKALRSVSIGAVQSLR